MLFRIGTNTFDKMFNGIFHQHENHFLFIRKMPMEYAFAEVGFFSDIFGRCGISTLFAKDIQSCLLKLPSGHGDSLPPCQLF